MYNLKTTNHLIIYLSLLLYYSCGAPETKSPQEENTTEDTIKQNLDSKGYHLPKSSLDSQDDILKIPSSTLFHLILQNTNQPVLGAKVKLLKEIEIECPELDYINDAPPEYWPQLTESTVNPSEDMDTPQDNGPCYGYSIAETFGPFESTNFISLYIEQNTSLMLVIESEHYYKQFNLEGTKAEFLVLNLEMDYQGSVYYHCDNLSVDSVTGDQPTDCDQDILLPEPTIKPFVECPEIYEPVCGYVPYVCNAEDCPDVEGSYQTFDNQCLLEQNSRATLERNGRCIEDL